jgi:hypothetical protein
MGARMVSWTGECIQVSMWHNEGPAGQAVRGFIIELLARASRLAQRRAAIEQRAVST